MAADQERAERIRALKQERPDLTWRRIADHVGVTERSATDWQRKGGIEYDNAKKLAQLFEVDVDYIWRGTDSGTPSPFAGQDDLADKLDRIEQRLDALDRIEGMLVSGEDIVARLDRLETALTQRVDAGADRLAAEIAQTEKALRSAPGQHPAAKRKTAPKRTRAA